MDRSKFKTVKINPNIHKRIKEYCNDNGFKLNMWIDNQLETCLESTNDYSLRGILIKTIVFDDYFLTLDELEKKLKLYLNFNIEITYNKKDNITTLNIFFLDESDIKRIIIITIINNNIKIKENNE